MPVDDLETQVADARRKIDASGYPMSIGELTNLYRDKELNVRPEFQCLYRWSNTQKSRLVESLLLGIPLPSIFVSQSSDGSWELIDGLQRVSTILELQGELREPGGNILPPLTLEATKYLPALEGRVWEHTEPGKGLSRAHRLDIKRTKIDIKILKRNSSPEAKFDLFQRLNSYGTKLTSQETRSALLVGAAPDFYAWVDRLSKLSAFISCISLSEKQKKERYDVELVLRLLVLYQRPIEKITQTSLRGFSIFLDDESLKLSTLGKGKRNSMEEHFTETFNRLNDALGANAFRAWDPSTAQFKGRFLNSAYEVFAIGLAYHIGTNSPHANLEEAVKKFWKLSVLRKGFATGKSTEARLTETIKLGRQLLAK